MIREPAVGADAHRRDPKRLLHDAMEGLVIPFMAKNLYPAHAPIEDVKQHPSRRNSGGSRHDHNPTRTAQPS